MYTTGELLMKFIVKIYNANYMSDYEYVSHEMRGDEILVRSKSSCGYYTDVSTIDLLEYITFVKNLELWN